MLNSAPTSLLNQYLTISRLLAGQLEFHSAIRAVAAEVAQIIPHDHMDVCIITLDGQYHTAYESGFETGWGRHPPAPISNSPIRQVLYGEAETMLTDDACNDLRFLYEGSFSGPIIENNLRSRLHVPLKAQGEIIGALSCSSREVGVYSQDDVEKARSIADLLAPYFFALRAAEQAKRSAIVEAEARAREEGLRLGALKLTEALEAERQRIGMDLHDQTLADLTRLARRMERLTLSPDIPGETLEPLFRSLQHCMHDLRQIIEEARPSVLQLFGFAQAIENHLDRSVRDSGSTVEWRLADEASGAIDSLEQPVATALFRIAQEAINNSIRHAHADRINVRLRATGKNVGVEVRDDGIGIAPGTKRSGGGIDNMRTRARLISARFEISRNKEGSGTCIQVTLPIAPKGAE
ncbi:GAF domain-containing sensor histidine kinase [Rhizobium sp. KVB221]|uniref:GAF domain-containing sensor histidine kinase n=1 Tax=Rhizobium setariae TaxID=2801340 RepID=A0A937CRA5_9HYPH|nr:GAF domain-containing sensor histidine kinase [Rhizobium setariae]MBL0375128.1 GAF domain-containing sensor histidine kinase [Rhizobium setariae]